eukprot:CAMPEP_0184291230 /NCGR_PEP_ID=MMETSP1049-20130417/3306_1 /TAXON_ID=77928 /ORGANISM="Proteomonas sulcata, Strain CCMP704" /LENGTH=52 /DNA_ID=CAMNT_0026598613 /DNA_START=747 /DNA_END=903 /DNA_ORIENTATION=-
MPALEAWKLQPPGKEGGGNEATELGELNLGIKGLARVAKELGAKELGGNGLG